MSLSFIREAIDRALDRSVFPLAIHRLIAQLLDASGSDERGGEDLGKGS
jgi:hypothetical protein